MLPKVPSFLAIVVICARLHRVTALGSCNISVSLMHDDARNNAYHDSHNVLCVAWQGLLCMQMEAPHAED
jgi:hypothetical protein